MEPAAWAEVEEVLTPAQAILFRQMPRYDQRHSLNVMRSLRAAGYIDPDLLTAALLHDAAKSAGPLRLWHRVAIVLLKAFAPRWLDWLAREVKPGHWRYPFYAHRVHPEIGARWAEEAGCVPLTAWLIAHHEKKPGCPSHRLRFEGCCPRGSCAPVGVLHSLPSLQVDGDSETRAGHLLAVLQWADSNN